MPAVGGRTPGTPPGDTDLAGPRDAVELAKRPEAERLRWRKPWADVDALPARAEVGKPK